MKPQYLPSVGLTLDELVDASVKILRLLEPASGYIGAFSGGKDSVVIRKIAEMAGVKVEWHYHQTTIDPPELTRFIRDAHSDVIWDRPKHGPMLIRAIAKGFPTRRNRWCCAEYKEGSVQPGRVAILGVRAAESPRRAANWRTVTYHRRARANVIAPILHWSDDDVWTFIRREGVAYCGLYDEGFKRLGCIGCPMARESARLAEFARWPQYGRAWRRVFRAIWERRTATGAEWMGSARWADADAMFEWWLSNDSLPARLDEEPEEECQTSMDMWSTPEDDP